MQRLLAQLRQPLITIASILRKNFLLELSVYNIINCIRHCKLLNQNIYKKIEFSKISLSIYLYFFVNIM